MMSLGLSQLELADLQQQKKKNLEHRVLKRQMCIKQEETNGIMSHMGSVGSTASWSLTLVQATD